MRADILDALRANATQLARIEDKLDALIMALAEDDEPPAAFDLDGNLIEPAGEPGLGGLDD